MNEESQRGKKGQERGMGVHSTEDAAAAGEGARISSCLPTGGPPRRGGRQKEWKRIGGTEQWWKAWEGRGRPSQSWTDPANHSLSRSNRNIAESLLGTECRARAPRTPPHVALKRPQELEACLLILQYHVWGSERAVPHPRSHSSQALFRAWSN